MTPRALAFFAFSAASSLAGCAPGLRVTRVEAVAERPANVVVFYNVMSGPDAVAGLPEEAFAVSEDGKPIPAGVDRVIVNPDLRAAQVTLLLLDLGGRPTPADLEAMTVAARAFVEHSPGAKRIAIYGVDGAEQPLVLAPLGSQAEALKATAKIAQWKTRDASLDMNGAYLAALRTWKQSDSGRGDPKIGNIVVIARGGDRASRVSPLKVAEETKKIEGDVRRFAIAFGAEAQAASLDAFTDSAAIPAPTAEALRDLSARLADAIEARGRSFYLLSYCSPSRGGEHQVSLDVTYARPLPGGGADAQHGSLTHAFRADGFSAGCTPHVPPQWAQDAAVASAARALTVGVDQAAPKAVGNTVAPLR